MRTRAPSTGLILLTLAACATPGTAAREEAADLRGRLAAEPLPSAGATLARAPVAGDWWTELGDADLNALVAHTLVHNLSSEEALARAREAAAAVRAARASLWPQISAAATSEDSSRATPETELGLEAAWTVDLFGRARQGAKGAEARAAAAIASTEDVQRLVVASTVSAYLNLRALETDLASTRRSEASLRDGLTKIERLSSAGYATALDVERSRRQYHDVRARAADLEGRVTAVRNALALLAGEPPGSALVPPAGLEVDFAMPPLAAPDPETLLSNRPDLRQAWLELEASAADAAAARRALLPDLSVSARAFESDAGRAALDFAKLETELIGRLAMPLLFRGRQLAGIDAADARLQGAALRYEQSLLTALSEADTALAETIAFRASAAEARKAADAARTARAQSQRLFDAGELGYLDVLFAEETVLEAERAERAAARNAALAWARYRTALAFS